MQAMCQYEVLGDEFSAQLDEFLADESDAASVRDYARALATHAWTNRDAIDARIATASQHWDVKRMSAVDRNILRAAVGELESHPDVPPPVVIDEAVEIAKLYGAADSSAFVNGVLDSIVKSAAPTPGA